MNEIVIDGEAINSVTADSEVEIHLVSVGGDEELDLGGVDQGGVSYGTFNYNELYNKPSIEEVTLEGNKSFEELGLNKVTNSEMEEIFKL